MLVQEVAHGQPAMQCIHLVTRSFRRLERNRSCWAQVPTGRPERSTARASGYGGGGGTESCDRQALLILNSSGGRAFVPESCIHGCVHAYVYAPQNRIWHIVPLNQHQKEGCQPLMCVLQQASDSAVHDHASHLPSRALHDTRLVRTTTELLCLMPQPDFGNPPLPNSSLDLALCRRTCPSGLTPHISLDCAVYTCTSLFGCLDSNSIRASAVPRLHLSSCSMTGSGNQRARRLHPHLPWQPQSGDTSR